MSDFLNEDNKVICKKCGGINQTEAKFCINCGEKIEIPELEKTPVEAEEVASTPWHESKGTPYGSANTVYGIQNQPSYHTNEPPKAESNMKGISIASMVCGIVSLLCCYVVFPLSIVSIVMGIISLNKKYDGKGMAIAGIITSGIAIVFYGLILILIGIGSVYDYL